MYKTYPGGKDMPTTVSTADARKNFADIVNNVAYGGEPVILTRRGREIAALVSMEELELLQLIEDRVDIEEAKKALAEPGDNIGAAEFWKQLGI
jgi:prevent-host-death family protein